MMLKFTPHMVFQLEIVAIKKDRRNKFFLVLASVSWSWKFHSFSWVCVTAVKQWASRIGVKLTWRRYLRPNEHWRQWSSLNTTWDRGISTSGNVLVLRSKQTIIQSEREFGVTWGKAYKIINRMSPLFDCGLSDHWSVLNCNNPTGLFIFITDRD